MEWVESSVIFILHCVSSADSFYIVGSLWFFAPNSYRLFLSLIQSCMPCLTNRLMLHSSGPGLVLFCQRNIFLPCRDFQLKTQRDLQEVPYCDSIIVNLILFKMYFLICTYMTTPIRPCSCSARQECCGIFRSHFGWWTSDVLFESLSTLSTFDLLATHPCWSEMTAICLLGPATIQQGERSTVLALELGCGAGLVELWCLQGAIFSSTGSFTEQGGSSHWDFGISTLLAFKKPVEPLFRRENIQTRVSAVQSDPGVGLAGEHWWQASHWGSQKKNLGRQ